MIDIALKEWAATCLALNRGEQVVLLRKGGLRDDHGSFQLESPRFWLMPTFLHQDARLVKPEFQDLLALAVPQEGEGDRFMELSLWAEAVRTWTVQPGADDVLSRVPHIWTEAYLDIRRGFRPEQPILCSALRVYRAAQPHVLKMGPRYLGCRSWIEIPALQATGSLPVLNDSEFAAALTAVESALATSGGV